MSLTIIPEKPIELQWQSSVIDIAPASKFGHRTDAASINTDLCMRNPDPDQPLSVPLSFLTADPPENQPPGPIIRIKKEIRQPAEVELEIQELENTVAQLAQQQGQDPEKAKQYIRYAASRAIRRYKTYVTIKPGQALYLRIYQRQRIKPLPGTQRYELTMMAPTPQFLLVQGGSVHVLALIPRPIAGLNVKLLFDQCTQGYNAATQAINGRELICWQWQNDPELKIVYEYS